MSFGATIAPSAAYYLWPPRWIGGPPPSTIWKTPTEEPTINPAELAEVVFEKPQTNDLRSRVYRDGLIIYDRPAWRERGTLGGDPSVQGDLLADYAGPRMRLINAHMACLAVSMNRFELRTAIVTAESLLGHDYDGDEIGLSCAGFEPAFMALSLARLESNPTWLDWRFDRKMRPVEVEEIERSYRLLDELLERPEGADALLHAELLARSQAALSDGDPSGALVYAWTALEALLKARFKAYLAERARTGRPDAEAKKPMNRERRKRLEESKDVTAWHINEILSLVDWVDSPLYAKIEDARKARNKWLHDKEIVSLKQAADALEATRELFKVTEGVEMRPYRLHSTDG